MTLRTTIRPPSLLAALLALALLLAGPTPARAQDDPPIAPTKDLLAAAPQLPPAALFLLAGQLFKEGRRDEAVTWFYIAQIRGRFRFAVHPNLPPRDEPETYEALFETLGPVINGWAFGDIPALMAHLTEALDWDATHPNTLTPKAPNKAALDNVRSGLARLRDSLPAQREEIRKDRAAKGMENR